MCKGSAEYKAGNGDCGVGIAFAGKDQLTEGAAAQKHGTPAYDAHAEEIHDAVVMGNRLIGEAEVELSEREVHGERGQQQGVFQAGLEARDVHRLISSFSFYQVSNFYTFSSLYLDDPLPAIDDEAMVAHHCDIAVRAVVRFVIS